MVDVYSVRHMEKKCFFKEAERRLVSMPLVSSYLW